MICHLDGIRSVFSMVNVYTSRLILDDKGEGDRFPCEGPDDAVYDL